MTYLAALDSLNLVDLTDDDLRRIDGGCVVCLIKDVITGGTGDDGTDYTVDCSNP